MERPAKIVAIHQPNFFPWLGYFAKMARVDCFVFLDNVQIPKTGGSWVNRVKLLMNQKAGWFTLPIDRSYHGTRLITEVQIAMGAGERTSLADKVRLNYKKAPFFDEVFPVLEPLLRNPEMNLAEFNIHAASSLAIRIGFPESMFVRSSSLPSIGEVSTDRLVTIVREVGGSAYLYGGGAVDYQENEKFDQTGLGVIAQTFAHPTYPQFNTAVFVPGLSVIDSLMNVGFAGTRELLTPTWKMT
ncbi:MAG: WbqC family protein [Verrucomicrobia bacterium]|nr:WbqC family protein [Verrucomicrobiota bacterium]MBU1910344.1 WbqC family protein [Verrucomicrobiota bacterium]